MNRLALAKVVPHKTRINACSMGENVFFRTNNVLMVQPIISTCQGNSMTYLCTGVVSVSEFSKLHAA